MPRARRAAAYQSAVFGQDPPEVTWPDPELDDGAVEELSPPDLLELCEDEPEPDDEPELVRPEPDECCAVEAWAEAGRV